MIRCNSFLSSYELVKCQLKPCFLLKNENTCWKVKVMPIKLPAVERRRVVGVLPLHSHWKKFSFEKFSFYNSNLCLIHPCQIPRITYINLPTDAVKRSLICLDLQIFKQTINFQYLQILTLPPPDAPICAFDTPEVIF